MIVVMKPGSATQQVERPSPRHRLMAWVAEVGRSFFPSMGLADWRSVMRGEKPGMRRPAGVQRLDCRTLAHELTHVVQQRSGPVEGTETGGGVRVSDPSDRFDALWDELDAIVKAGT